MKWQKTRCDVSHSWGGHFKHLPSTMPLRFTYIHKHTHKIKYFEFLLDSKPLETQLKKATGFCCLGKLSLFLLIYNFWTTQASKNLIFSISQKYKGNCKKAWKLLTTSITAQKWNKNGKYKYQTEEIFWNEVQRINWKSRKIIHKQEQQHHFKTVRANNILCIRVNPYGPHYCNTGSRRMCNISRTINNHCQVPHKSSDILAQYLKYPRFDPNLQLT